MYYRSGSGKQVYHVNPIWERLESDDPNARIDKNTIVLEQTRDMTKHYLKVSEHKCVRYQKRRYPRLDRLTEEHF